jgi:hypothetical protein
MPLINPTYDQPTRRKPKPQGKFLAAPSTRIMRTLKGIRAFLIFPPVHAESDPNKGWPNGHPAVWSHNPPSINSGPSLQYESRVITCPENDQVVMAALVKLNVTPQGQASVLVVRSFQG